MTAALLDPGRTDAGARWTRRPLPEQGDSGRHRRSLSARPDVRDTAATNVARETEGHFRANPQVRAKEKTADSQSLVVYTQALLMSEGAQRKGDSLRAVTHLELGVELLDVPFDGPQAEDQLRGDLAVCFPLDKQRKHFGLPGR